jgi:hypothetical protein
MPLPNTQIKIAPWGGLELLQDILTLHNDDENPFPTDLILLPLNL